METVTLHYHRPPDRTDVFRQELLFADDAVLVTYLAHPPMKRPFVVDGAVGLEDGSPAIWFTFPGRMHDVGRFHSADRAFTGLYANIMRPIERHSRLEWRAVDLFLDVWIPVGGEPRIVDADELAEAVAKGWIDDATHDAALAEAEQIVARYREGAWPPAIVNEWTLARVLARNFV